MSLISKEDVIEQLRYEAETDENQDHKFAYERAAHIIATMPPVDDNMTFQCECNSCKYNDDGICEHFSGIVKLDDNGECASRIEKDDDYESESI